MRSTTPRTRISPVYPGSRMPAPSPGAASTQTGTRDTHSACSSEAARPVDRPCPGDREGEESAAGGREDERPQAERLADAGGDAGGARTARALDGALQAGR